MRKCAAILMFGIVLLMCANAQARDNSLTVKALKILNTDNKRVNTRQNDADKAKSWLVSSIELRYRGSVEDKTIKMYSNKYQELKQDAIGTEYDGLTQEQFTAKWKGKYNLKYVTSNSIMIGQQDWGKIVVRQCVLKNRLADRGFMFSVIIEDDQDYPNMKEHYKHKRDIKVIPSGNTYLIDDIIRLNIYHNRPH